MNYEAPILNEISEYEPPVLLDLEEVAAGCGVCITGGSGAQDTGGGT